jgi:membrane-bound ClpP family serine protease
MSKKAYNIYSLVRFFLEEAALLALCFWILPHFNIEIPIWLIILLMAVLAIYNTITSVLVARIFEKRSVLGLEALISSKCQAVTDLDPDGYVKVGTELWRACSVSGSIKNGNEVKIEKVQGLVLMVTISEPDDLIVG